MNITILAIVVVSAGLLLEKLFGRDAFIPIVGLLGLLGIILPLIGIAATIIYD